MEDVLQVLVVDDDAVDRMATRRHLSKSGLAIEISEAETAAAAHILLFQERYSCIFLDYRLPDTDGIALVTQLRAEGILTPIIVLTGQGDEQVAVALIKAGASDYLPKSNLSPETLARSIRSAIKVYLAEQRIRAAQLQLQQTNELLKRQNHELEEQRGQIEQQNLRLLETNRLKSEFLATVTHEIRTPLNAIMGFSQILKGQSKGPLNNYQTEMVERIFINGQNLLALVNDILDMSTIEANRLDLKPTSFDLKELIQETIAQLSSLIGDKELVIRTAINIKDTEIYNDESRLKQVCINLIHNAIKFTPSGRIGVTVNPSALNGIEIIVQDTGIGIDADQLDHIFKPFRQGDQTTKRQYPGTGLGLAITHSLVSMMEGFITVDSQVGVGSTFRVYIPRELLNPVPHRKVAASSLPNRRS